MIPTYKAEMELIQRRSGMNLNFESLRKFFYDLTHDLELSEKMAAKKIMEDSIPSGTKHV